MPFTSESASIAGKMSNRRGIPNKKGNEVKHLVMSLCKDGKFPDGPAGVLTQIMMGVDPQDRVHPFFYVVQDLVTILKSSGLDLASAGIDPDKFLERATEELVRAPVPLSDQKDAAKVLMEYLYPKLRSVEFSGTMEMGLGVMRIPAMNPEALADDSWARVASAQQSQLSRSVIDAEPVSADPESSS